MANADPAAERDRSGRPLLSGRITPGYGDQVLRHVLIDSDIADVGRLAAEIRVYEAGRGGRHGTGPLRPATGHVLTRRGYSLRDPE
jgi:hypothetical protein